MEAAALGFFGALVGGAIAVLGNLILANRQSEQRVREHRYGKIYERQLDVYATIYRHLADFELAAKQVVAENSSQNNSQPFIKALNTLESATRYFEQHRLYVEPDLDQRIGLILIRCSLTLADIRIQGNNKESTIPSESSTEPRRSLSTELNTKLPELRKCLAKRFRRTLDISET